MGMYLFHKLIKLVIIKIDKLIIICKNGIYTTSKQTDSSLH